MHHIFHLLTESEPFSEQKGGAISRWTANVLRNDSDATVLAPSSDNSWGFGPGRVVDLPGLVRYKSFIDKGGHLAPWSARYFMLRRSIEPALRTLKRGDTVWVHARPEFAAALEPMVHARGARLFLHLHNSHLVQWSTKVTKAVHADRYIFNSCYLRDEALEKFPDLPHTAVLANGADPNMFYPVPAPKSPEAIATVLFASRLVPDKGLHVFLDAMRLLLERGTELRGVVVGGSGFGGSLPTPYVLEMQARAPVNVRFEPYCAGPLLAERFRNADIYCLPACWHDPFPMTVLEAMASGVPVVASESGGIPQQLSQGGGLMVPRNSAPDLADALARLAMNPGLRAEMGRQALDSFRANYTWETVRTTYRQILQPTRMPQPFEMADCLQESHA